MLLPMQAQGRCSCQKQGGEFRVIMYASLSLIDVKRRCSQTEGETLAIVWACESFHTYLYGVKFHIVTGHKPLEVLNSKRSNRPARIERLVLRMQEFDYTVEYKTCLLYTSPSPRDLSTSRMPSSA